MATTRTGFDSIIVTVHVRFVRWARFVVWFCAQIERRLPRPVALRLCRLLLLLAVFQLRITGGPIRRARWRWCRVALHADQAV